MSDQFKVYLIWVAMFFPLATIVLLVIGFTFLYALGGAAVIIALVTIADFIKDKFRKRRR